MYICHLFVVKNVSILNHSDISPFTFILYISYDVYNLVFFLTECSSTTFGQNCASQCTCDFSNTQSCEKTNGTCTCNAGWQGVNCTEDVPECTNDPSICGANAICTEQIGSYLCTCDTGYEKDSSGNCIGMKSAKQSGLTSRIFVT